MRSREIPAEVAADPYQGSKDLLGERVGFPANLPVGLEVGSIEADFLLYGSDLWRHMRMALFYWTPERVEIEALRRAADSPGPSALAREVALFTIHYEKWAAGISDWRQLPAIRGRSTDGRIEQSMFVLAAARETLKALERRAAAAEARATDFRLRYEFDRLRREFANRESASEIADAIRNATAHSDEGHLTAVVARLGALEKRFGAIQHIEQEVDFIAERAMQEFARKELPGAPERTLRLLANAVPGGFVKTVLAMLLKRFVS